METAIERGTPNVSSSKSCPLSNNLRGSSQVNERGRRRLAPYLDRSVCWPLLTNSNRTVILFSETGDGPNRIAYVVPLRGWGRTLQGAEIKRPCD